MRAIKIHQIDGGMKNAPLYYNKTTQQQHQSYPASYTFSRMCACRVQHLKDLACEILQYNLVCWVNVRSLPAAVAAASARYRYLCQHSSKSILNVCAETLALTLSTLVVYNIL